MADEMNQLFNDIMKECYSEGRLSQFSDSVRDRLEKYERNVRKEIVSRLDLDNTAPLFPACKSGKEEMVAYLISTCGADVEQRGYYNGVDEMVSPLWCAAANNVRMQIIEYLLRHGGEVNAVSDFGTTPVLVACSHVAVDVVECLVEHGADINRANVRGKTCLMAAVPSVKLCEFLLKNGAEVNARDNENWTALHYAIDCRNLFTVKLLLDYGADVTLRSLDNDDALQAACIKGYQPVFDYLFDYLEERGSYSPGRLADANELMGSSKAFNYKEQTTLEYWRKAIEIRHSNTVDGKPLAKTPVMPNRDCYGNASEFTSFRELNVIAQDSNALKIQRLLVLERILGEHHQATFFGLAIAGYSYFKTLQDQYCFGLWRRALEIGVACDSISLDVFGVVTGHLVQALYIESANGNRFPEEQQAAEQSVLFADVVEVFKILTSRFVPPQAPIERELQERRSYDGILRYITHLMDLLVQTARTSEAAVEVRALVRTLVNQNPMTLSNRNTVLHLSVSCDDTSNYWPSNKEIFPNFEVTKLLLECKADVNAQNEDGKTPLHIASCSEDFSNQMVKLLLDHGAHLDMPDNWGSTPAHILSVKPDNTVDLGNYMTLRCLAAQAIVKYEIQCNGLAAFVNQFVDLHRVSL